MVIYWYLTKAMCSEQQTSPRRKNSTPKGLVVHDWAKEKVNNLVEYLRQHNAAKVDAIVVCLNNELVNPLWLEVVLNQSTLSALTQGTRCELVSDHIEAAKIIKESHPSPNKTVIVIGDKPDLVGIRTVFGGSFSSMAGYLELCKVGNFVRQTKKRTERDRDHWDIR